MADPEVLERREVPVEEWAQAVAEARDAAYTFFDWLTAVDETDAEENPGSTSSATSWTSRRPRRCGAS